MIKFGQISQQLWCLGRVQCKVQCTVQCIILVHSTIYTVMFSSLNSTMLCAMCRRQVKCVPEGLSQVCNFYAWVHVIVQCTVQCTLHCTLYNVVLGMCGVQALIELWLHSQRRPKGVGTARLWSHPFISKSLYHRSYCWNSGKSNIALAGLLFLPEST